MNDYGLICLPKEYTDAVIESLHTRLSTTDVVHTFPQKVDYFWELVLDDAPVICDDSLVIRLLTKNVDVDWDYAFTEDSDIAYETGAVFCKILNKSIAFSPSYKDGLDSEISTLRQMGHDVVINDSGVVTTNLTKSVLQQTDHYIINADFGLLLTTCIVGNDINTVRESLCYAPFLTSHHQPSMSIYCCHETSNNHNLHNSVGEYWNGDRVKDIRKHLLAGKAHPDCEQCLANGVEATRSFAKAHWDNGRRYQLNDDFSLENGPVSMTFVPSNVCNLSCKMCSADSSTTYDKLVVQSGMHEQPRGKLTLTDVDYDILSEYVSGLEYLSITGGDMMFDSDNLAKVLNITDPFKNDLDISLVTNGHFVDWELMERLSKYRKCVYVVSLDGDEKTCSQQRLLSNRKRVVQNVLKIRRLYPHVVLECAMAVGQITCCSLYNFSVELVEQFSNSFDRLNVNFIRFPEPYAIWNVPNRSEVIQYLKDNIDKIDERLPDNIRTALIHGNERALLEIVSREPTQADINFRNERESYWQFIPVKWVDG